MEPRAQSVIASFRHMLEHTADPPFHATCQGSQSYWNWRVLRAALDTGGAYGRYTVVPHRLDYNTRARRITSRTDEDDGDSGSCPPMVGVAWMRDRALSMEEFEKGHTGMVAAFECAWGSRNPYHVRRGVLNWADVRAIMSSFSRLAFVKARIKVMCFSTRILSESGGDNWEFLTNMMKAQARAVHRYYPVDEEWAFVAWPSGVRSLSEPRSMVWNPAAMPGGSGR